jgi:hypothetical protein
LSYFIAHDSNSFKHFRFFIANISFISEFNVKSPLFTILLNHLAKKITKDLKNQTKLIYGILARNVIFSQEAVFIQL